MQEETQTRIPVENKETPLTLDRFKKEINTYLEHGGDLTALSEISPQSLYSLITAQMAVDTGLASEAVLFYPVVCGENKPEKKDERRRLEVLMLLCMKILDYRDSDHRPKGEELLKQMLQNNLEDDPKTVLHIAAQNQHSPQIIRYLIQLANTLGISDYVNIKDDPTLGRNFTPLFYAADTLQCENIKVLLAQGANAQVRHPELGTVSEYLKQKIGDPRSAQAIELLIPYDPERASDLKSYLRQFRSPTPKDIKENKFREKIPTLRDVIEARTLFQLAQSKETSLSIFIAFLQKTSNAFANNENTTLRQRFLSDLDAVKKDFLQKARLGILNSDEAEQGETFAVASWLLNQARPEAALALFQKLISDEHSIFLNNDPQMFKLLRWSAIAIGHIQQRNQPKIKKMIEEEFLAPVHETDNVKDLLDVLHSSRQSRIEELRWPVTRLLCYFLQGQQASLPLVKSVTIEQKRSASTPIRTPSMASSSGSMAQSSMSTTSAMATDTLPLGSLLTSPGLSHFAPMPTRNISTPGEVPVADTKLSGCGESETSAGTASVKQRQDNEDGVERKKNSRF